MQVYIELAVLENFCMDFTLMYAAKRLIKNPAGFARLAIAAALGASFAVVFPLIPLPAWAQVILKILSALILTAVGGKFRSFKGYIKLTAAFLILSALLAGALIGVFSLAGIEYEEGGGFILSSVPIGIPLFAALILALGIKKLARKFSKGGKIEVHCRIFVGQSRAEIKGFFDSGNKVYSHGAPVSVIPENVAQKLVDISRIEGGVKIHTVAGSEVLKVFTADKLEVDFGDKTNIYSGVKLGVSPQRISCAVLHPDILED